MFWIQVSRLWFVLLFLCGRLGLNYAAVKHYDSINSYSFSYGVNDPYSGDIKHHSESRVGDVVTGQYSQVEPDGSIREVKYTADPVNGFNAYVTNSPAPTHPGNHLESKAVSSPLSPGQKPTIIAHGPTPISIQRPTLTAAYRPIPIAVTPAPVYSSPVYHTYEQNYGIPKKELSYILGDAHNEFPYVYY